MRRIEDGYGNLDELLTELQELRKFCRAVALAAGELEGLPDGQAFEITWLNEEDKLYSDGFMTVDMIRRAASAHENTVNLQTRLKRANACLRACAGLSTEQLHDNCIGKLVQATRELLKAYERSTDTSTDLPTGTTEAEAEANAALAPFYRR